ncbi:MAG: GDSL-type esterase/lipase family protein [Eubacterium sp.]|nr:GDSL-type esterase/lipase family protein [Eubacterium sp.]
MPSTSNLSENIPGNPSEIASANAPVNASETTSANAPVWTAIYGNAISIRENRPESYAKDITLRYPIHSPFSGKAIRITLDNYCGTEAVTITRTTIRSGETFFPVTFEGKTSATIPAGERIVSDPVMMPVEAGEVCFVQLYLGDFTKMRSAVYASGPRSGGMYAMGDQSLVKDWDINISRKTNHYYFFSDASILTEAGKHVIVCYGDSITAQDWPDYLQLRCEKEGANNTAIVRKATSGSRILREYHNIRYESYGLMGKNRFNHELPVDGADTVIIQQGINDIIHPVGTDRNPYRPWSDLPTAADMIEGLKWYIGQARLLHYNVYMGTLLPIAGWRTFADFRDELRCEVNDWIRTTDLIDGCIDFDAAVRCPKEPVRFDDGCDSGDHLHPSKEGYRRMASAVPEKLLY